MKNIPWKLSWWAKVGFITSSGALICVCIRGESAIADTQAASKVPEKLKQIIGNGDYPPNCEVRPDQICDLQQVPCKPIRTCSTVRLATTKLSPHQLSRWGGCMDMDIQLDYKQNMSKGGGAPCEPTAIHIWCPTVSADIFPQLGYCFLGGWWQDLHSGHH